MAGRTSDDSLMELIDLLIRELRANAATNAEGFDRVNASIDRVSTNIDHLTATVDRLALNVGQLAQQVSEQRKAIDGHLAVAKEQTGNVAQLIELAKQQQQAISVFLAKN